MIQSITLEGSDVQRFIANKLAPACEGEKITHSVLSMLTYSVLLMHPEIEVEELKKIVMETSEFMVISLAPITITGMVN